MANMRHTLSQVDGTGALFIAGTCTPSGGNVATLSNLTGPAAMQADISATLASSVFTITIAPFLGPLGKAVVFTAPTHATAGVFATLVSKTYTADSLAVIVNTFSAESTAADET